MGFLLSKRPALAPDGASLHPDTLGPMMREQGGCACVGFPASAAGGGRVLSLCVLWDTRLIGMSWADWVSMKPACPRRLCAECANENLDGIIGLFLDTFSRLGSP